MPFDTPRQVRIQSQRRFGLSSDEAVTVVQCAAESAEQTKGHGEDLLDMDKVARDEDGQHHLEHMREDGTKSCPLAEQRWRSFLH